MSDYIEYEQKPPILKGEFDRGGIRAFNPSGGLTIREYFAGLAMQGFIESSAAACDESDPDFDPKVPAVIAADAVRCADALLAELAKPQEAKDA